MAEPNSLQAAFILHTRAFRETSLIVELFSQAAGRVSCIAQSARGPKSRFRGLLQAFAPILIQYSGRGDLFRLQQLELAGMAYQLHGNALLSGLYLNELLCRLLLRQEAMPDLFTDYQNSLQALEQQPDLCDIHLRYFELQLLQSLGYALPLTHDASSGDEINAAHYYRYEAKTGFHRCQASTPSPQIFCGASLLALQHKSLQQKQHRLDAKRLLRQALAPLIGDKPLKSRELFLISS